MIAVALVTNSTSHAHEVNNNALSWIETHYPNVQIVPQNIEIL